MIKSTRRAGKKIETNKRETEAAKPVRVSTLGLANLWLKPTIYNFYGATDQNDRVAIIKIGKYNLACGKN